MDHAHVRIHMIREIFSITTFFLIHVQKPLKPYGTFKGTPWFPSRTASLDQVVQDRNENWKTNFPFNSSSFLGNPKQYNIKKFTYYTVYTQYICITWWLSRVFDVVVLFGWIYSTNVLMPLDPWGEHQVVIKGWCLTLYLFGFSKQTSKQNTAKRGSYHVHLHRRVVNLHNRLVRNDSLRPRRKSQRRCRKTPQTVT